MSVFNWLPFEHIFPRVGMAQPKFTFPILNVKDYAVVKLAEALLGSEFPPLAVQGDGNCLLRFCRVRMHVYVCMYVCTNVCMHIIMQCWNVRPDVHDVRQISKW